MQHRLSKPVCGLLVGAVLGFCAVSPAGDPQLGFASLFPPAGYSGSILAAAPELADMDHDDDLDFLLGNSDGTVSLIRNTGTPGSSAFPTTGSPLFPASVGSFARLTLGDIDGDGDLDAFVGQALTSTIFFFQNTGHPTGHAFASAVSNPFFISSTVSNVIPELVDIDGDGDLDLFVGRGDGYAAFFQNTGTRKNPLFAPPMLTFAGLSDVGDYAAPCAADVDGDGDYDMLVGELSSMKFFRNTGNRTNPQFAAPLSNPFGFSPTGFKNIPEWKDLNTDGDLDLLMGAQTQLRYHDNTCSQSVFITCPAPVTSSEDRVVYFVEFYQRMSDSFSVADITETGTVGPSRIILAEDPANPRYSVTMIPNNPNKNGTMSFSISSSAKNMAGVPLGFSPPSPVRNILNPFPKGDVSKNGTFDLADVALLADANLSLVTLP